MSIIDSLAEIGRDLTKIEVNTVYKDGMTGRKMPWFPHALIDIAQTYVGALEHMGMRTSALQGLLALEEPVREAGERDDQTTIHPLRKAALATAGSASRSVDIDNGWDTFDKLRWAAALMLAEIDQAAAASRAPRYRLQPGDVSIVLRIRGSCDQIKAMLERLRKDPAWKPYLWETPPDTIPQQRPTGKGKTRYQLISADVPTTNLPRLNAEDATRIRKIWEVGVERIVAQTVIQIDGDVITRIQEGLSDQELQSLLQVQRSGVDTGVRYWSTLLDIAERLIDGLASKLFR
jgi:hypothetical protein